MKKYNYLYLLILTIGFISSNSFCMQQKIDKALNLEKLIPKLVNYTLDNKPLNKEEVYKLLNIKELASLLNQHAETISEALENIKNPYEINLENIKKPHYIKLLLKQMSIAIPYQVKKLRIASYAVGLPVITWLIGHSFFHETMEAFEPQRFCSAGGAAIGLTLVLYQIYQLFNPPRPVAEILLSEATIKFARSKNKDFDKIPKIVSQTVIQTVISEAISNLKNIHKD